MRKFLSIVIPRYKETEREIFPLLSSIYNQVGIDYSDIEIIIANDGNGPGQLDKDFISLFDPIDIKQVDLKENRGPGVARQVGLDKAIGEYVLFCDADDSLHNVGVLNTFITEAEKSVPDIITSSWLEELMTEEGNYIYVTHQQENTWMHGKLLRRQFLVQNNLKFHKDLRVHEDSYFLCIAAALAQRSIHIPFVSYIWKYHPNSITRCNGASYTYDSIPTFIKACSLAHKEVEKINPDLMEYKILQFTLYNYFCFHQPGWQLPEHEGYLRDAEAAFVKNIKPMWHYWKDAAPEKIAEVYNQERNRSFGGCVEKETIDMWIKRLGLK